MTEWRALLLTDTESFNQQILDVPVGERTMFVGADLSGADLGAARLASLDLSDADLSGSTVAGYWLSTCRLQRTASRFGRPRRRLLAGDDLGDPGAVGGR